MSSSSLTSGSPPPLAERPGVPPMASQDLDERIPDAIVIKNIPFNVKQESLLDIIASLSLPTPQSFNYHLDQLGAFRGLAFATFRSAADADAVIATLNGFDVHGRKLLVEHRKVPDAGERMGIEKPSINLKTLNTDGTTKRPMNAFMIFARRRRPQISAENQAMRTGEISMILSKEWNMMQATEKQFYEDQARQLKDTLKGSLLSTKYPVGKQRMDSTQGVDSPDRPNVTLNLSPAAVSQTRQSGIPNVSGKKPADELDLNDPSTLELYSKILFFRDHLAHDELTFSQLLSPRQQRVVYLLVQKLGVYLSFVGEGEEKHAVVTRFDPQSQVSAAAVIASQSSLHNEGDDDGFWHWRNRRMTKTCSRCRAAKRKCNRKRPCERCIQLGLTDVCAYDSDVEDPVDRADYYFEKPGQQAEQPSKGLQKKQPPVFDSHLAVSSVHAPSLDIKTSRSRVPGLAITDSLQKGDGVIEDVDSRLQSASSDHTSLLYVENPPGSSGSAPTFSSIPASTDLDRSKDSYESSAVHARWLSDGDGVGRGFGATKTRSKDVGITRAMSTSFPAVPVPTSSVGYEDDEDEINVDVEDEGDSDHLANVSPSFSPTPSATFLSSFSLPTTQGSLTYREGDIISGFTLGPIIGYGASSTIRQAFAASGDVVAVKVINSSANWKGENLVHSRKQIEREVSIWTTLSHEHILPLFSAVQTKNADYFFTIYCPSGTLFDVLKRDGSPALPQDDAGMMFRQVVKGLQYLHEVALLVHGDVKLDNVLVDESGICRIGGFGMTRRIDERYEGEDARRAFQVDHTIVHPTNIFKVEASEKVFALRPPISHPGLPLVEMKFKSGSLPYTAPELLLHAPAGPSIPDPAQDIWALGVLLHGLLTGRLPFTDTFNPRLRQKILNGAYEIPPGIGHSAERVLQGCLHRSQGSRWTIAMVDEVAWGIGWGSEDNDHTAEDVQQPRQADMSELPRSLPQDSTTSTSTSGWREQSQIDDASFHRYSIGCSTADQAYAHITNKASEIHNALVRLGFEGAYSLHAGFNEEMVRLGQKQEEIYIILGSAISGDVCSAFEGITSPFPGIVYTPEEIHFIPTATPKLKNVIDGSNVLLGLSDTSDRRPAADGATSSGGRKDGGVSRDTGNKKGKGKETSKEGERGQGQDGRGSGDDDDEDDIRRGGGRGGGGGGGGGGEGGGGGGGGRGTEDDDDDHSPRMINVPFSSTLSVKPGEDPSSLPTKFTTTSCLDITINSNHKAISPPPDSKWSGPWFGVDIAKLSISARNVTPNLSPYTLGLSQIRIAASSCPTSVIQWLPDITHAEEDTVKAKRERNITLGGWLTLAASPNARLGGTGSRTDGTEGVQRRWQIMVHELSAGDGPSGAGEYKGVQWQYTHNEHSGAFKGVTAESPKPKPSVVFGFNKMPDRSMPLLEVTMVVYWSLNGTSNGHSLLQSFPFRRSKEGSRKGIPAFLNLLHHVSVVVDLGKVGPGRSWIVNGDAVDERTVEGLAESKVPIILSPLSRIAANDETSGMPSNTLKSDCEILVRQAVQGRVAALTEGERTGAMLLLPIPESGIASSPMVLPTPPPSPQPPVRAAGNSSSDTRIVN